MIWMLVRFALPWVLAGSALLGAYSYVTTKAYNRGVAARDADARETINRMEARLKEALRRNENLTDDELDCALKRLRNPAAPCR